MTMYLQDVIKHKCLSTQGAYEAMSFLCQEDTSPYQTAAFLAALQMRFLHVEETVGFLRCLRDRLTPIYTTAPSIDMCGTGGDHANTFNISTAAALIVASAESSAKSAADTVGDSRWPHCC